MAVALSTLVEEADRYLGSAKIADYCPNGLQVEGRPQVMRIVSGVTASQALLDAAVEAEADLVLVHAGTVDLTRLFAHQRMRPLLVGADTPRAMTEAYATLKRLTQRPGWMAHDLLIVADPRGPRTERLGESLAECAERFLGAAIHDCVVIDPHTEPQLADARLTHLLRAQMAQDLLHDSAAMPLAHHAPAVH